MRLADYVAARCAEGGIKHVFTVTGGGAMHLNDAFFRRGDITAICFHHEQSAAIAADGYFRVCNRPAVLNVTSGPGGINALTGVYGAFVDSIGMIVISGQVKRETIASNFDIPLRQLGDQEAAITEIARPVVKYVHLLQDPREVREVLDKALFLATHGRPGPVWIDVPIDVQSADIDPNHLRAWDRADISSLLNDRSVTPNARFELKNIDQCNIDDLVSKTLQRLRTASRPVVLLGTGVRLAAIERQLYELLDVLGVPVVTGWNAHDVLPNSSPWYCGRPGSVGDRPGNFAVQNSDFILILGCRLNIRQISYNWKSFAARAFKVMVDADRAELDKPTLTIDLKICADLKAVVQCLLQKTKDYARPPEHGKFLSWCRERVSRYPTVLPNYRHDRSPINPYFFIEKLFDGLSDGDVIVAGNGSACVIGFQAAKVKPGQRFFTNSGCASMGYDLPAAIGAALARPGSRVICIAGDGSLMMNLQELQTLVGYSLSVKVIVINNNGYHSIRQTQENYFPDNVYGTGPNDGVTLPDFVKLSVALQIPSERVTKSSEWDSHHVEQLMESAGPALIEVIVDPSQPFSPKLTSRRLPDGTMMSPALEDMSPFLSSEEMRSNYFED